MPGGWSTSPGEEHLQLTTEGAELISRLADGAMRDALSILDTCAGVTSQIDASVVRKMAGVTDRSYLFRISDAITAQDGATALACLAQLRQQDSVDIKRLTDELIAHYRAPDAGGPARRAGAADRCLARGRSPLSAKRPGAGPAGTHPGHPAAGQRAGAHGPRQRPAH